VTVSIETQFVFRHQMLADESLVHAYQTQMGFPRIHCCRKVKPHKSLSFYLFWDVTQSRLIVI